MRDIMRFARATLVACILLFAYEANAEWTANVSGPDVFGNIKALAVVDGRHDGLLIQCNQKDQLILAYIFQIKPFDTINSVPAKLLLQTNGGSPLSFDATLGSWNDNFGSVSVAGRQPEIVEAVRAIGAAKGSINVGYEVNGHQESASFDSVGSGSAMNTIVKKCQLDTISNSKGSVPKS